MTPSVPTREAPERVSATVAVELDEEVRVAQGQVDIGLKNDQIMQRYLVRRIFREAEFTIKEFDGHEVTGFITGFDDKCLQVSTTPKFAEDEIRSELIFWPIAKISETGRKIDHLEHEHKTKMRSYSHALRAQCEKTLAPTDKPPQKITKKHPPAVTPNGSAIQFTDQV